MFWLGKICNILAKHAQSSAPKTSHQKMQTPLEKKILNQYSVHLLADNLPVATKWELEGKARVVEPVKTRRNIMVLLGNS